MTKQIEITNQHFNEWDPECGIEFTCTECWEVCLCRHYKFCPLCGVQLIWATDDRALDEMRYKGFK